MKRILITGTESYLGINLKKWLLKEPEKYNIDTIDMKNNEWKLRDFSSYDVVYHVAGLVHKKETSKNIDLYFKINRDLAFETAKKAKREGVKQFIFLSSMSVYGVTTGVITKDTKVAPNSAYGTSKKQAEDAIKELEDSSFKIVILRPPIIYGKECPGNYKVLAKFAVITPIFPNLDNHRSMLYIDNLSELVKQLIDNEDSGLFFPQNKEYINTAVLVKTIAAAHGKRVLLTNIFNFILKRMHNELVEKVTSNLVYDKHLSEYKSEYRVYDFEESILLTER